MNAINNLNPGRSVRISGDSQVWVIAERSGDGKTIRLVRCTKGGSEVFKTYSV